MRTPASIVARWPDSPPPARAARRSLRSRVVRRALRRRPALMSRADPRARAGEHPGDRREREREDHGEGRREPEGHERDASASTRRERRLEERVDAGGSRDEPAASRETTRGGRTPRRSAGAAALRVVLVDRRAGRREARAPRRPRAAMPTIIAPRVTRAPKTIQPTRIGWSARAERRAHRREARRLRQARERPR